MTCIAGIASGGRVWIGGDAGTYDDEEAWILKEPKVFKNGDFLIGISGSGRAHGLLKYAFVPPDHPASLTDLEFLNQIFVTELRKQMDAYGFLKNVNGIDSLKNFAALLGYNGELYFIEDDLQVGQTVNDINACGAGGTAARAAMLAQPASVKPVARIKKALHVAEYMSTKVRSPFTVLSI